MTSDPAYEDALRQYVSNNDVHHILTKYNVTLKELIDLCGGIQPGTTGLRVEILSSHEADIIHVKIFTDSYDLVRSIDFGYKTILNRHMHVYQQKKGIATNLLITQIKTAKKHLFRKLNAVASAPDEYEDVKWAGYYCWGRLGYVMVAADSSDFNLWMKSRNRKEKTLEELLATEEGREFWRINGYSWTGEFYLDDNGESLRILGAYLKSKEKSITF